MQKFLGLVLLLAATTAVADDARIKQKLEKLGMQNVVVSDAPVAGLRTAISDNGVFYASEDGQYVLQGALVQLGDDGSIKDLTNAPLMGKLEAAEKEMIIYPAKEQKHVVTVFTDITCPYCSKFHHEVKKLNDLGVTVRYLAYPRAGSNSEAARQMETIWTAKDRNAALDAAELSHQEPQAASSAELVRKHYVLGHQFGVNGTPAIVLADGKVLPGYMKAQELVDVLEKP